MSEIGEDVSVYGNYAMLRALHKKRKEEMIARHKELRNQIGAEFKRRFDDANISCLREIHELNFILAKEEETWRKNKMLLKTSQEGVDGGSGSGRAKKRKADQEVEEIQRILVANNYQPAMAQMNLIDENRKSEGDSVTKRPRKSILDITNKLFLKREKENTATATVPLQQQQQQYKPEQQFVNHNIMEMASNLRVAPLVLSDDEPEIQFVGESSHDFLTTCRQQPWIKQEPTSPLPDNCLEQAISN